MKTNENRITTAVPGKVDNYIIVEALHADSVGKNFRAVELHRGTPQGHKLLTEVHPFLLKNPDQWRPINVLNKRMQRANHPNLPVYEKVIETDDGIFLVFPFFNGKTLAQIVEDVSQKETPIPFDLVFFISIAAAALVEKGAAILEKAKCRDRFHGFLTPDHIIIDYDGNIFLKYFGLWPLFDENGIETAVEEMIRKYGAWLSPEFIRKEKPVPQSDFYYLGYIVYRMLTGNYFSYLPGEDFESTFTSISFVSDLPSTDIEFLTTIINFFKKTLNPAVKKRFADIREFNDYISRFFPSPPHDAARDQSRLAAYMKILYSDTIEDEEKILAVELTGPLPENQVNDDKGMEGEIVETAFMEEAAREGKKRSKLLPAFLLIIIVILAGGTYFLIDQLNKSKKEQLSAAKLLEQRDKEKKEFERKLREVQQKMNTIGKQKTSSQKEQEDKDDAISRLKEQEKELKKEVEARADPTPEKDPAKQAMKKEVKKDTPETKTESKKRTPVEPSQEPGKPQTPTQTPLPTIKKDKSKTPTDTAVTPVLPVPLEEVTKKPVKISGKEPKFPPEMIKTYAGRRATVNARLLINETGCVIQVDIVDKGKIPDDVQAVIVKSLKKWKYKPAQKGKNKVRVWCPFKMKIHFKHSGL